MYMESKKNIKNLVSPMLVSEITEYLKHIIMSQEYVLLQTKINGWCCMANTRTRKIYSRNGHEITTLPHINAALPVDGPEWLHGELYKHGFELNEIMSMIKLGNNKIEFHVFDCVSDNPFSLRWIEQVPIFTGGPIYNVQTIQITPKEIHQAYELSLKDGFEGVIIRLDGHGYEHNRSVNVFKMKPNTKIKL